MKILLTNDDGIDAPGLAALCEAVSDLGEIRVVAPEAPHSGCSHHATTESPLHLREVGARRFAVDGTPVDCVRLGLSEVLADADWVVAGINWGGNLGVDVLMSGTVAAAREAALLGIPAIALSQYCRRPEIDWSSAALWAREVVGGLQQRELGTREFWNVNFPDLSVAGTLEGDVTKPPHRDCPLELGPLPVRFERVADAWQYRCDYHRRPSHPGSDVAVCFAGEISITRVPVW
ncbi:MAG: 5'/3'-nucleotidase SurE [Planctomycetaceae bacterium]|nr:5'/3'-nucleotidase SurE [Planctomycetaceae bacterium]